MQSAHSLLYALFIVFFVFFFAFSQIHSQCKKIKKGLSQLQTLVVNL